jgi:hypothetical protein
MSCFFVIIAVGGAEKWSVAQEDTAKPSLCELANFDETDFPEVVVYIPTYDGKFRCSSALYTT